jgi:hypothetical protein
MLLPAYAEMGLGSIIVIASWPNNRVSDRVIQAINYVLFWKFGCLLSIII